MVTMGSEREYNCVKPDKKMKVSQEILNSLSKLTFDNEHIRLQSEISLLKSLFKLKANLDNEELTYCLKRLIRGLGSSKMLSRKGYYSTLTTYFKENLDTKIDQVDQVIEIMEAELKPSSSLSKSEKGYIFMGRILLCGSLTRSKLLFNCPPNKQLLILEILLSAGTQKSYLSFVSISFLIYFIDQFDEKYVKANFWPLLAKELGKNWSEHSLDTFYALLHIRVKFPSLIKKKFIKQHLGTENIIDKETINDLLKLITDTPRIISYQHPLYKILCQLLVSSENVVDFWNGIDQRFNVHPSKSMEYLALELLNFIVPNIEDKSILPSLLSSNFLNWMVGRFNIDARYRHDDVANLFRKVLAHFVVALGDKEIKPKIKIAVLKKLINYPGDFMIEKITEVKVIQLITTSMNFNGVKKLAKFYCGIVDNSEPKKAGDKKEESWNYAERSYAGELLCKLLGHPTVDANHDWRLEQVKFLFNLGFCETENVSVDLASHFKDSFYRALDHKLKLSDLHYVLNELVKHLNNILFLNKTQTLRTPLDESAIEVWKKMINFISKLNDDSKNNEAVLIFYVMDLNMGLQIFSDSAMAISNINEIHSCYERLTQKKSKKSKKKEEDEPEWVDVIVDLLLSLLSQNSHLLRSLVQRVFPHICSVLTSTSIHRILEVLDPKDDKGPLVPQGTENDSSDDESNSEDENSDDNNESSCKNKFGKKNNDDEEDEDDESEDDDDEENYDEDDDEEDEDETLNERLRLAVRQALGDASAHPEDNDIDLDEIDEEEGRRLDESLAAAFRILRESRPSNKKKQGKSAETLTHFRGRVMDLLDIYLDSGPSMALALDMLIPLFALLEFCIKDIHQESLKCRVRSCLKKLSSVKKFKDTTGVDEKLLIDLATILVDKGERSTSVCQEMGDKLAECYTFLIRCFQQTGLPQDSLVKIYIESLKAFFTKRDCVLPASLFKNTLHFSWTGNWQLVPLIIDYIFDNTIRSFRRSQALEFLIIFYRNIRLIKNEEYTKLRLKIEKKLYKHTIKLLQELVANQHIIKTENESSKVENNVTSKELRQKFVCLLWTLLNVIYPHHLPQAWDWKNIASLITEYRQKNSLSMDAKNAYKKLASHIGASTNRKTKVKEQEQKPMVNGVHTENSAEQKKNDDNDDDKKKNNEESSEENDEDLAKKLKKELKKKLKNRSKQGDKQKLKKEAREIRAKAMAEGLETVNFSSVIIPNEITEDEPMETTESKENRIREEISKKELNKTSIKKRANPDNERSSKKKKRKNV
ncbi:myb-binding protein 1A-like [Microplitis mediator]|uniref:myb-binding protein 1A-like n=1 Tax=Microplitis mediator TaxID=375433 RepID=UPI002553C75B|nr:myb-binding protein 1A-like [Microplitis mediator]